MSRVWLFCRVVLAGALLWLVLSRVDPGAALEVVRAAPWWAFALPMGLLIGNTLLHGFRLYLLAPSPRPGLLAFLRVALLGNFAGLFLPSGGGEAAKVVALSREVGGYDRAVTVLGVVRLMELLPWGLLLAWGGGAVLPGRLPEMVPLAFVGSIGMIGTVAAGGVVLHQGEAVSAWIPARFRPRLRRLVLLETPPWRVGLCFLLAFPFALVNVAVVWIILAAYGAPLDVPTVLGLVPSLDVIIALPITISGLGVREGAFVHAFAAWSVPESVALAVAFTRWSAEIGRASLGGVLFALGRRRIVTRP